MVTRKTRLLSAVAAVLMLVSMFTCFALPVIAEGITLDPNAPVAWPEAWLEDSANIIRYKNRVASDTTTKDYAIVDATDWMAVIYDSNDRETGPLEGTGNRNNIDGLRFWFIDDLDFSIVTLSKTVLYDAAAATYWKDADTAGGFDDGAIYGQGHTIKNYNLDITADITNGNNKAQGFIGVALNSVIRDLTIDSSCSFTYKNTISAGISHYYGAFVGWNQGSTIINCHNEANVIAYDNAADTAVAYVRNVAPFGLTSKGGKIINCSNTGNMTTDDGGYAAFTWGLGTTALTIQNCFNTGTFTSTSDAKEGFLATEKEGAAAKVDAENVYTVGTSASAGTIDTEVEALAKKVTVLSTGADASGELAYLFNKNYAEYPGADRLYYSMKNGAMVYGTELTRTVKIQAYDGETPLGVTYANIGDTIDVSTLKGESDAAVFVSDSGIVNGTSYTVAEPGVDNEIRIMALAANQVYNGFLAEKVAYFAERIPDLFKNEDGEALTAGELQAIQSKLTAGYTSQDEINNDLVFLNGFVFDPASAVPILDRAKYPEAVNFAVANLKELEYLSANVSEFGLTDTICFTADIDATGWTADTYTDIDGDVNHLHGLDASLVGKKADGTKAKITGLYIDGQAYDATKATYTGWLGRYYGAAVKNIAFENCEVVNAGNYCGLVASYVYNLEMTFENLSFNNCTVTAKNYATGGQGAGFIAGIIYADYAVVTFKDISVTNCTLNRDGENNGNFSNSGLLLGKDYQKNTVIAENIYLNNNTIAKPEVPGSGIMFGEIMDTISIKNATILNTYMDEDSKGVRASLIGALKSSADYQAVATIDNIIIANNSYEIPVIQYTVAAPLVTMSNVYADATALTVSGTADVALDPASSVSGELVEASVIASGKVAAALNAADVEQQWSMDGTTPIFASETAKATVAVTFKALDAKLKDAEAPIATYTLYTDKNGKLIGLTQEILDAASWNNEADLATATFDSENNEVIGYTTPAHDHQLEYTVNGDDTHDVTCTFSHTDAELGTFTCDYKVEGVPHEIVKENISNVQTTPPSWAHQVVDACKYCDYVADESTAVDCTGTKSVDEDRSWDPTCGHGGMKITVCDACDYEFRAIAIPYPHSWGDWTHVEGTKTHKRTCANVNECGEADQVEDCTFENWTINTWPTVDSEGEEIGTCECGNTDTRVVPMLAGILVEPGKAVVGNTLEVAIDVVNYTEIAGLELSITYDADLLTLCGAKNADWNMVFDDEFPAASGVTTTKFNLVSNTNLEGDGTVVILEFTVKNDEALVGTKTNIKVDVTEAFDGDMNPVTLVGNEAEVELLTALIKGDINGDRFVNMADAILLLRYYTEKPQGETEWTINNLTIADKIADITDEGDGADLGEGQLAPEVNINDVLYLLRYLNGWYTDADFFGE